MANNSILFRELGVFKKNDLEILTNSFGLNKDKLTL